MQGTRMRTSMDVSKGESGVMLRGLTPGNTYTLRASAAAAGQLAKLELAPTKATAKAAKEVSVLNARKNAIRFTATAEQVAFKVIAAAEQQATTVPMFLSVTCETCATEEEVKTSPLADLVNLQVTPNVSAQSLISNTLIGGDCFTISNVTSVGNSLARGTFSNGSTNIGIGSGMVMSTGRISILPGPNNQAGANGGFGVDGFDPDLSAIVPGDLLDVNTIEFDFTPTANTVQFDFVFGSEEYCEYVGTEFNDAFGFFISGPGIAGVQNIAVIPGTGGVPVTTNNVNHETNSQFYVNNSATFFQCNFLPANHIPECQLDGWTTPLTATATVIPCATYHIKLAIADVTDENWDSAVFLRANSFNAGGSVSASPAYIDNQNSAYENCTQGAIRFARGNGDLSQPLVVNFTVSPASTATEGLDYFAIDNPIVIPVGQSEIIEPINVFADGIPEGEEKIILLIDNSCQCQQSTVEFVINDDQPFSVHIVQDTTICEGSSATLTAVVDGGVGPFTYNWVAGGNTESIVVSPATSSSFTVLVTDACGGTAGAEAQVEVQPIFRNTINTSICSGGSVNINGVVYTAATEVQDTSYENSDCGRITTYIISVDAPARGAGNISFCRGSSVEIGGQVYTEPGTVIDTVSTALGCDSIVTYTLEYLPNTFGADTIAFCPGDAVEIGGVLYNLPGTVQDTLTGVSGCDSIVTHTLVHLQQPTRAETISFCPGKSVVVGGVTITDPGTLIAISPATTGCDTIVTYTFELLPNNTRSETIAFCPGETVTLGGTNYTQPGTVVLTHPGIVGCDTIVTYTLQYLIPAPSTVSITCPQTISINVQSGASGAAVTYHDPTASSDCPCPGMDITRTSGFASGSTFPMGVTQVCFKAQDACGNTKSCCFNVSVEEENPCDTKVIGCIKYELLTITQDQFKNKTYRVRVTNNCSSQLIYTAIQTPSGLVAMAPADNSVYTAPSGNKYLVRSPNYSPFYSVRYRSMGGGILNGESDILRYTLPAQAEVLFIDVITRLSIQQYYEAHLNTFYCPIGVTPADERNDEIGQTILEDAGAVLLFPNPSDGSFNVDLALWEGETVHMQVFNSQGQRVWFGETTGTMEPMRLDLPNGTADGLYFLEVATDAGDKEVLKFVVKH